MVLVVSVAVYPMLRRGWRPGVPLALLIMIPTLLLVVSMRDLGPSAGNLSLADTLQQSASHPAEAWKQLILGPDTEMFSGLAVEMQVVPTQLGFRPGYTAYELATHLIPRSLWSDKPFASDGLIDNYLYGHLGVRASDGSAAYSVLGTFYFDSGFFGVGLGMALIGFLLGVLWHYLRVNSENDMVRLLYATALPATVVLMRGTPSDTVARLLFVTAPVPLVALLARRRRHD
jgi:hypothetical protein